MFVLISASACTAPVIPATGGNGATVATLTPTPVSPHQSTLVPTIQSSPTTQPQPTITPFIPFKAVTQLDYVNVRDNPGLFFGVNMNVSKGTVFTVLGKAPGNEWVYIQTPANTNGWVYAKLLKGDQDLATALTVHPNNVQYITGQVVDEKGSPVSGINFSIVQGENSETIMTAPDGSFYAYLPPSSSGQWTISYTGMDCSSNLMDNKCNCKADICGAANPPVVNIQVPNNRALTFTWK